jgi:YbbR domain-containing protein
MPRIWPFRHLGLKALSVGLGLLLWMVIAGEQTVERGVRVPLELQQVPAGLEFQGEPPTLVDVRLRGAAGTVARVAPGDVVAVVDLGTATPGRRLYQLTPEQVRVPFGVQVVQVTPATVALVFEPSATRHVPIVPDIEGDPAPGFVIGEVKVDPKTIEVVGPASAVAGVAEAITETISVAGAAQPVSHTVTIGFLDPSLRLKAPRRATVEVDVRPGPRERRVEGRPVHLRDLLAGLTAQAIPSTVDVVLRGSREGVARVRADQVTANVQLAGLGPGDYLLTVQVDALEGSGVARVEPEAVQVRVSSVKN